MIKDEYFMKEALKEARKALKKDEVPVGAVAVLNNKIITRAHNEIHARLDPTAHAEMLVLQKTSKILRNERLNNVSIYVTLEPCAMCAYGMVLGRIKKLVIGCCDEKTGACGSVFNITANTKLNHRIKVAKGIFLLESSLLLKEFFKRKRS